MDDHKIPAGVWVAAATSIMIAAARATKVAEEALAVGAL